MKTETYLTAAYNRSEIISFHELDEKQQAEAKSYHEDCEDDMFVLFKYSDGREEPLSLSNFMRTGRPGFGAYGLSYFSAYMIYISRCGTKAVVCYRHW